VKEKTKKIKEKIPQSSFLKPNSKYVGESQPYLEHQVRNLGGT
jgi:hypothetical protein